VIGMKVGSCVEMESPGPPLIYPFTHPYGRSGSCKGAPTPLADCHREGPLFYSSLRRPSWGFYLSTLSPSLFFASSSLFLFLLHRFSRSYLLSFLSLSLSLFSSVLHLCPSLAHFCLLSDCSSIPSLLSVLAHVYGFMPGSEEIFEFKNGLVTWLGSVADPLGSRLEQAQPFNYMRCAPMFS